MAQKEPLVAEIGVTLGRLTKQLASAEARMVKSAYKFEKDFNSISDRGVKSFKKVDVAVQRTSRQISKLRNVLVGALSVREIQRFADAWTVAENKIAAAGQVAGRSGRSVSDLVTIADETRAGLTETVDLYAKLLRATKDVAQSEEEVARATLIVNQAFKAGGAAASEQAAGILQLGQGLSSGVLQGDELRSLRENAPLIAQAIANEFNTTIGGLKELGAQGELTAGRVFQAILAGGPEIEAAFAQTNATIGEGFTRLRNALTEYISVGDDSVEATQRIGNALVALADNLDLVIAAGGVLAGVAIGPPLQKALIKARVMITGATAGLAGLSTGAKVSAASIGALRGALGLLGGPVGVVIATLSVLPLVLDSTNDKISDLSDTSSAAMIALDRYAAASRSAADEQDRLAGKVSVATAEILTQSRAQLQTALRELRSEMKDMEDDLAGDRLLGLASSKLTSIGQQLQTALDWRAPGNSFLEGLVTEIDAVVSRGGAGISDLSNMLQELGGIGEETDTAVRQLFETLADKGNLSPETLKIAGDELTRVAEATGMFGEEIERVKSAGSDLDKRMALSALALKMQESVVAAKEMFRATEQGALDSAKALAEAQLEAKLMQAALSGDADEVDRILERLEAARLEAAGLAGASGDITFDTAATSAKELADQLTRALTAAQDLASQGVADQDKARINYEFRDRPVDRAGALAAATFDAKTSVAPGTDPIILKMIQQERSEYIAAARAAEEYRQATTDARKASKAAGKLDPLFDDSEGQIETLTLQIEMLGKTDAEVAALTARYTLLEEAKKRGINLDKLQINSNMTVREEIEAQSAAIGRLTDEYGKASDQQQFFADAQADVKNGMLDAIIEGENLGGVLENLAKSFARAALEAAMFGSGPFSQAAGGAGGMLGALGSALGGLFGGSGMTSSPMPRLRPTPSYDGGGFTGFGSRTGGVDGKGGFDAVVHPNESIIDHTKGGAGGGTTVLSQSFDIKVQGGDNNPERIVAALRPAMREEALSVMARAKRERMK